MDDRSILAPLVDRYREICSLPVMEENRKNWSSLHSLREPRPLIHTRFFAFGEMEESACFCSDPLLRQIEYQLRRNLFWSTLGDDSVFEPWVQLKAVHAEPLWGRSLIEDAAKDGEHMVSTQVIERLGQWSNVLGPAVHRIDRDRTEGRLEVVSQAIGDLIEIDLDCTPLYSHWHGDLSTDLGLLRGLGPLLYDLVDEPSELHRLISWMSSQVLRAQQSAEEQGDWSYTSSVNQSMTYSQELPWPEANSHGARQEQLWGFMASQEFTMVSPQMFNEFLLEYQIPILSRYGLTAYGCCEDLTDKICYLKRIPNLRRVAVTPFARLKECVDQLADGYVISYRPNPTEMVSIPVGEQEIEKRLEQDLSILKGCFFDITLKDVETVGHDPDRVREWVSCVRRVCDRLGY